jgi:hypothetical protein
LWNCGKKFGLVAVNPATEMLYAVAQYQQRDVQCLIVMDYLVTRRLTDGNVGGLEFHNNLRLPMPVVKDSIATPFPFPDLQAHLVRHTPLGIPQFTNHPQSKMLADPFFGCNAYPPCAQIIPQVQLTPAFLQAYVSSRQVQIHFISDFVLALQINFLSLQYKHKDRKLE